MQKALKVVDDILEDEVIFGVIEEGILAENLMEVLEGMDNCGNEIIMVEVHTQAIYDEILKFVRNGEVVENYGMNPKVMVNTTHKTMAKKIKPVATQLPFDTDDHIR